MKKVFSILGFILLLLSCEEETVVEKINFTTEYKFSAEIEEDVTNDTLPWKYQISASDHAKKGDYKNALKHWDLAFKPRERRYEEREVDSLKSNFTAVSAFNYILEQAEENQVIIINEAHHNSLHRAFTKSLLKELFYKGYKNLGLEALSEDVDVVNALNTRNYPVLESGYYIKDPQFGNLVREALEIGYTLFAYEATGDKDGKPREMAQARNIQKIIDANPNEKFLIHCGFAHALEGNHRFWEKAMAGRLAEYTGINPLTINQTAYSEKSKPEYNHPVLKIFKINEPTVLLDKDNNPLRYERGETSTDIAILHPNTAYINDRPDWLFENGNRNVSISLTDLQMEFPVMVLAYKKGEDINAAVPVDIAEVKNQQDNVNLGLMKGVYDIIVTNGKASVKFEKKV